MKPLLFFLLLVPFLAAQTTSEVDVTAEPLHHVALDNDYVRVLKVEIPPHAATLLHRHRHDYIYVSLGDAHISNAVEGKPAVETTLTAGETRFAEGNFAHVVKNLTDRPFRVVATELVQDEKLRQTPSHWPGESGEKTFSGGSSKILFVKDGVRVSELNLAPGAVEPSHRHERPYLVVALSDLDLRSDVEGAGSTPARLKAGDFTWRPGAYTHTVTNVGKDPARLVILEF